jgi:hypothetical protein
LLGIDPKQVLCSVVQTPTMSEASNALQYAHGWGNPVHFEQSLTLAEPQVHDVIIAILVDASAPASPESPFELPQP